MFDEPECERAWEEADEKYGGFPSESVWEAVVGLCLRKPKYETNLWLFQLDSQLVTENWGQAVRAICGLEVWEPPDGLWRKSERQKPNIE